MYPGDKQPPSISKAIWIPFKDRSQIKIQINFLNARMKLQMSCIFEKIIEI